MDSPAHLLRPSRPGRLAFLILLGLLLPAAMSACRGAEGGGPLATVVAPETRGSLQTSGDLPSLASVVEVERSGASASSEVREHGDEWVGRWEATWLADPVKGRTARREIYEEASGPLAAALGSEGVRGTLEAVEDAISAAEATDLSALPSAYLERLDDARKLLARSRRSFERERSAEALRRALQAADRIRSVRPERVARTLLRRAREGREEDRSSGKREERSPEEQRRIDRLIRGAEVALEEGDHRLAIHRAFYACRLLGVTLSGS